MKIHGTAKGGALSNKDFGVAFGGNGAGAELIWQQLETGEEEGLSSGDVVRAGELFTTGHVVIDSIPTKFVFNLRISGTPTGIATLNLIDSSDTVKATFPLESTGLPLEVGDLTDSFVSHNFVNDSNTFPILNGYRVVFYYTGGQYFRIQLCSSCAESGTKETIYISSWSNHPAKVCTMKVYGTPA